MAKLEGCRLVPPAQEGTGSDRNGQAVWVVDGFSRPVNRLVGVWVVLVNVLRAGFGVFLPETDGSKTSKG